MDERNESQQPKKTHAAKPLREHPKPDVGSVNSLNQAVRQELWYVDTMVASPFRTVRRQLQNQKGAWAQGADEAVWAMEGMARLPIKLLQSAFGEPLGPKSPGTNGAGPNSDTP